ncbi:MAG: glutamate synthase large subunit [Alphaproteobacteria bacterium]
MLKKIKKKGLYDPSYEKDSCGIGFVANIYDISSRSIIDNALQILCNLTHRGAVSADPRAGDGVGILTQIPHQFFQKELLKSNVILPRPDDYAVGMFFMPKNSDENEYCLKIVIKHLEKFGLEILHIRKVPVDRKVLGHSIKGNEPTIIQIFIKQTVNTKTINEFESKLFLARRYMEIELKSFEFYVSSLSPRVVTYKGMIMSNSLKDFYQDLKDEMYVSSLAIVHQRFSTNTFPSWELAQPFRFLCHNGEINTLRGNVNWMNARARISESKLFSKEFKDINPLIFEGVSDSAAFDNALEYLMIGGYDIEQAMMLMIPEAWEKNKFNSPEVRSFYKYFSNYIEPWDGPAAMCFTDGRKIGGVLDRNGLRPSRYLETEDGMILLSSEMGVLDIDQSKVVKRSRLEPGKIFLIDLVEKKVLGNKDLKLKYSKTSNYEKFLKQKQIFIEDLLSSEEEEIENKKLDTNKLQLAFGYTKEDITYFLEPIITSGMEPTGSMGTDTPISLLSSKPKLLFSYFKQCFAQVTNPPIDPIREELVMSLDVTLGAKPNIFSTPETNKNFRLELQHPVLNNQEMNAVLNIEKSSNGKLKSGIIEILFKNSSKGDELKEALDKICLKAQSLVSEGKNIIILSDKNVSTVNAPIPSLLAVSAVHHFLIREGLRMKVSLVIETAEARELHHLAVLIGYGAEAINPYLALDTIKSLVENKDKQEAIKMFKKASGKAILKIMSKMGISTVKSYCGAQIFDAIGVSEKVINSYFPGTASLIGGIDLKQIQEETLERFNTLFSEDQRRSKLDVGGEYAYRVNGEKHSWSPSSITNLQHAVRINSKDTFKKFSEEINNHNESMYTIRSLFDFKKTEPIPIEDVEPVQEIVKRFSTGAMSFGSISKEAHTTLAIAMNKIGGKSNTGEGGEETERFKPLENGDSMRSAIKQVASGRFGVTTEYLVNANDIQIKISQGAKPGEGGQLPGHKVDEKIAAVRHSTPGVGLISPPPHHDIYSIEDLAQLIFDLKNVNPQARISVKLVSEFGVGVVAAGVTKCKADHITIAGYDGGTGASPLTSIKNAVTPWELGLAETHQTLVLNKLRSRISLQVDGGLKTGRDVVIGALLGADEFGFSTAPLVSVGCIMMRKCHLNTCPVGIATQNKELRKKFKGTPENVINYFFLVAEEVREIMANLGFSTLDKLIGRSDLLTKQKLIDHWKAKNIDLSKILWKSPSDNQDDNYNSSFQNHDVDKVADHEIIKKSKKVLEGKDSSIRIDMQISNTDRSFGALISGEIAKKFGFAGLNEDSIVVNLKGTAGQSFGAFLSKGLTLNLTGEGNDYVGKGLSGGIITIKPFPNKKIQASKNIIVGNTVLYGAISGECYFSGMAGERFAVRNSGAITVVEGTGDHCCEYMTGGIVLVLGKTGVNFGAGMSGGIAYVYDEGGDFKEKCNQSMVELEQIDSLNIGNKDKIFDKYNFLENDELRIKEMLKRHVNYTNSSKAKMIMDNLENELKKFVKVLPVDFKKVLLSKDDNFEEKSKDNNLWQK